MTLQNHKAPKKPKKKVEKASKHKPEIKKGITKVDLNSHYYSKELHDYCKDHKLSIQGSKKDFVARILAHVEGRDQPPIKGKKGKKRKKKSE